MLEISQMVLEENRETHYMHGIHAFALEEMHAKDPWAQHAVAHVLYFKQRIGGAAKCSWFIITFTTYENSFWR